MIMPSKLYDVLKWVVMVGFYGLNYLWTNLAETWGFPYAVEISKTIMIVGGTLGIWLGISSITYHLKQKDEVVEDE